MEFQEVMSGVSIIICTYNGKERLDSTLESVINQKCEDSLNRELIIVDNLSTDDTPEYCRQFLSNAKVSISWKIVSETNAGLNHARLKGLNEAKYDIVLFCDDDNSLAEDYVQIGYSVFKAHPGVGAVGGCGIPSFEGKKPDWFDKYSFSFAVGPQASQSGIMKSRPAELYGAGTFFRRNPLLTFFDKGFETIMSDRKGKTLASGGDVEWCYLIQLMGYKLYYDNNLTFGHQMPEGRMNWEYYLRLKQGIASGVGQLLPYSYFFKNPHGSTFGFFSYWFKKSFLVTMIFLKLQAMSFLQRKQLTREMELSKTIWLAKMISYWRSGQIGCKHFLQLKSVI